MGCKLRLYPLKRGVEVWVCGAGEGLQRGSGMSSMTAILPNIIRLSWHLQVRHWAAAHPSGSALHSLLANEIQRMHRSMQSEVASADIRSLNKNEGFVHVFGRITNLSEEGRSQVAEAIWSAGSKHEDGASLDLLRTAASARLDLSSDTEFNRERLLQMRKDIVRIGRDMAIRDSTLLQAHLREQNLDKNLLATALFTLNFFEEALAVYDEALKFWKGQDGEEVQVAITYNGIGLVLYNIGRFNDSIEVRVSLSVYVFVWYAYRSPASAS